MMGDVNPSADPAATWPSDAPARRGRPPKGSRGLTREAILDAAIALIDADGVESLSMRTVAKRLSVDAKSLYNYVASKDDLLDSVAEQILTGIRLPDPTGELTDDLRAIALTFRANTLAHPRAGALVLTRQLSSRAGLRPVEGVLSVLRNAGCDPEESVHLLRTLLATVIGTLLREVSAGPAFGSNTPEATARRQRDLQSSGLPSVSEAAPYLSRFSQDEEFDYAIELIIDAVRRRTDEKAR